MKKKQIYLQTEAQKPEIISKEPFCTIPCQQAHTVGYFSIFMLLLFCLWAHHTPPILSWVWISSHPCLQIDYTQVLSMKDTANRLFDLFALTVFQN